MTITELEQFFATCELPQEIQLDVAVKITNVPKFVQSHFDIIKSHGHVKALVAFQDRLIQLKDLLEPQ
ncbi:hypothetical protein GZH53_13880 [Flavihumibacter sp. R14]|nr:hypothetical protein [Flavihumibacter soli]